MWGIYANAHVLNNAKTEKTYEYYKSRRRQRYVYKIIGFKNGASTEQHKNIN